jgi:hypothetical protein
VVDQTDLYNSSGAGFTETITLLDRHLDTCIHCIDQLVSHRCRTTHHHPERAEVILVDHRMLTEKQDNRWDHISIGRFVILDKSAEGLEIEFFYHDESEAAVDASVNHQIEGWAVVSALSEQRIVEELAVDVIER